MLKIRMKMLKSKPQARAERGVITMAETLIVLVLATSALLIWVNSKLTEMEAEAAQAAGRNIAAYARAAAEWLADSPPAADGSFTITSLQDCADPAGARFLPCSFNANTPIPHVFNAAGDPATFDDLVIVVDVLPAGGTNGDIDFGVFRGGNDDNADGLPDSRPDLAAIAFRAASEETGAGVFEFFRLQFARNDLTGLVTDPSDPAFDLTAWDDLSRLLAEVGAQVDAPFLRVDGGNEMNAGLTFRNGMQINMNDDDLNFEGPGDVGVQTDTGTLVVLTSVQTTGLAADTADIDALTVRPEDGVRGAGFDRLDQSADVVRLNTVTADHESRITANTTNIAANLVSITANQQAIAANRNSIATNRSNIATNTANISSHRTRITAAETKNTNQDSTLTGHGGRISALENRPPPSVPPTCISGRTHAEDVRYMQANGGWTHDIGGACPVGRRKEIGYGTYIDPQNGRDPVTLKCNRHVFHRCVNN